MQFKTITKHKLPFFVALGLITVLTSCGSFQYAGYDDDGIYSSEDYNTTEVEQPVVTTSTNDSDYYKNYFADSSAQLEAVMEDNEVFTDIDSYEGNYLERTQDTIEQRPVYGGWGQNNESITINIIDNGWYGWNDPWMWNAGWGYGWNNWGWNNWRWNSGWRYGYGWNNWGWNAGWGYGWNNWGWGPGWGYGWNNWGWNGYHRGNRYAYNAGRRSSMINNNYLNRASRSSSALSRRNNSSSRLSRSATGSSVGRSNSAVRTSRNGTIRNSSRSSSSRISRPNTSRSSGTVRSARSSRSSSGTIRSTRSSRSSSGSVRSSRSSSSRSSGSMRSSGSSRSSSSGSRSGGSSSRRGRG
ncbi:hypothetical protein [Winogradskyella marincola]|uniref:Vitellogenin II n=1 Tax=Winogradskyella marincola TaxID=3037795 RepID=A0ABT6G340_9FLAO|nr:hypothetical protein [Winogradskyella sp. YYF002]MDG4716457.1 hypothetical protein [Winogradskyella sp. YYF002]